MAVDFSEVEEEVEQDMLSVLCNSRIPFGNFFSEGLWCSMTEIQFFDGFFRGIGNFF